MNFNVTPKAVTTDGAFFVKLKEKCQSFPDELITLRNKADEYMNTVPYSITYKKLIPPSGDPKDYMSMGIYWWPNPDTPNGLPYIRKDGVRNPETIDKNSYGAMANAAYYLAIAAYFFEDENYAKKAVDFLYTWHIDEDLKMNPNAKYAQCIPGICDGRAAGIVDFTGTRNTFDAVEMLYSFGAMPEDYYKKIKEWYVEFINWLLTSEIGIAEDLAGNNHGSWFDTQILAAAIFTERPYLIKRVCTLAYSRRIKPHITEKGEQPAELNRTKGLNYSLYNLRALLYLGIMAKTKGYKDFMQVDPDKGVCLVRKAIDYIHYYANHLDEFPYEEIAKDHVKHGLSTVLTLAYIYFEDESLLEIKKELNAPGAMENIIPL